MGVIGLGHRGLSLLESMMAYPECQVVALSDLYENRRQKGGAPVEMLDFTRGKYKARAPQVVVEIPE